MGRFSTSIPTWTQDDEGLSYQKNPRVKETTISDSDENSRKTRVEYTSFGLPSDVYEYQSDGVKVLRRVHTDYRVDPVQDEAYLSRRIIGLVKAQMVYDGNGDDNDGNDILASKVEYTYDEIDESELALLVSAGTPTQHDTANYGTSLRVGRGLVTKVRRVNVQNMSNATVTRIGYNTVGSAYLTRDAEGHQTLVSYVDSFSDISNTNTAAYPTRVTNADGYFSETTYNYTMGVVSSTRAPSSGGTGSQSVTYLEQKMLYDAAGRIVRATNQNNQAYRRWVYGFNNYPFAQTYSTVNGVADNQYYIELYDGAGHMHKWAANHPNSPSQPNSPSGGFRGQDIKFDVMGRPVEQSNPAEITDTWTPAGDDTGWVYTTQAYDWKGRPTVTTNLADGTTTEAIYGGCGCAGGEVVTTRDQVGRRQKIFFDVLGRVSKVKRLLPQPKTESLNDQGEVYLTTVTGYNALNQVMSVKQYSGAETTDGSCPSGTCQQTTQTYHGYGRLQTSKKPEQSGPASYSYYDDDTLKTMTDARGATTTYTYNNRHLVAGITYGGGYTAPSVAFEYDAAGSRTFMSDGMGNTTYAYDTLSRMVSETRYFSPLGQSFTLSYGYNLADQLTSLTDQNANTAVYYAYDNEGRPAGVNGSGYASSIIDFALGIKYRAWGAVKSMGFGNGRSLTVKYNSRMLPSEYDIPGVMQKNYNYYYDGMLKYSQDELDARYDRKNSYDHSRRISMAVTGTKARDGGFIDGPYHQTYQYDVWSNMTARASQHWTADYDDAATYTNNRRGGWN